MRIEPFTALVARARYSCGNVFLSLLSLLAPWLRVSPRPIQREVLAAEEELVNSIKFVPVITTSLVYFKCTLSHVSDHSFVRVVECTDC